MATPIISLAELAKHGSPSDCWIAVKGQVWDVTEFLPRHPGGEKLLLSYAGRDATGAFLSVHALEVLAAQLAKGKRVGSLEGGAAPAPGGPQRDVNVAQLLSLDDVEAAARERLSATSYAYYSTGATDEVTLRANRLAMEQVALVPRVLVDVSAVDTRAVLLGHAARLPVFISAAAMGRLAHPDGECCLSRGAARAGAVQMVPLLGSCSLEEVAAARRPGQVQFLQLYVHKAAAECLATLRRAEALGFSALFITVDAATVGKRERDIRAKLAAAGAGALLGTAPRSGSSQWDEALNWDKVAWLQQQTKLPIVLKGIQCGADAVRAARAGCAGVMVSNHGGRNLDQCRPTLRILPEVTEALRAAGLSLPVFVDGGVRRGVDVFKALALGATAVGIGRPALFGMAAAGEDGVAHVFEVLRSELVTTMKLMGTPSLSDIKPEQLEVAPAGDARSRL